MDTTPQQCPECDPSLLPSLAIECIYEHYIEAGVRSRGTPWGAQEWLASQYPLRGSPEFCNAARRKDKHVASRVAGMCLCPWPGIECAPNVLGTSSATLVVGMWRSSGRTTSMNALAQEYAHTSVSGDDTSTVCAPMPVTSCERGRYSVRPDSLRAYLRTLGQDTHYGIVTVDANLFLLRRYQNVSDPIRNLAALLQSVHSDANAHLIVTVTATQHIADARVSSAADRILIVMGRHSTSERTELAQYVANMLGLGEGALITPFVSLAPYAQLILERRPGHARDEPFHHTNTIILIKNPVSQ